MSRAARRLTWRPAAVVAVATLPLTRLERRALDHLRAVGAFNTDTDAIRCGLVHLARHLKVDIRDTAVFALREDEA